MDLENEKENSLNLVIEKALARRDISGAVDACVFFLNTVYGEKAVGLWALRDFAANRINSNVGLRSRFDNNLLKTLDARKEKIFGYQKPRYESPYFKDETLEALDSAYEEYKNRADGKPNKERFIKFINQAIEEL